jgi:hypothetical protein
MQNIHSGALPTSRVTAMFEDGLSTFPLSNDITFGDLAGRLDHLSRRRCGRAIAFVVKFD